MKFPTISNIPNYYVNPENNYSIYKTKQELTTWTILKYLAYLGSCATVIFGASSSFGGSGSSAAGVGVAVVYYKDTCSRKIIWN